MLRKDAPQESPLCCGEEIELHITGFSHQGMGIGRAGDIAVFMAGALPGETVRGHIVQVKKRYAIARLAEILKKSPQRREAPCPYFGLCGGCVLQHAAYEEQLKLKKGRVEESLARIGGLRNVQVKDMCPSPKEFFYRNRGRFHISGTGPELRLGYFAAGSRQIIDIERCLLLEDALQNMLTYLRRRLPEFDLGKLEQIALQGNRRGRLGMVLISTAAHSMYKGMAAEFIKDRPEIAYIAHYNSSKNTVQGSKWHHLAGEQVLEEEICGLNFSLSPGSFIQVNAGQTENLYRQVLDFAGLKGQETVLDLYCGIGTISLYLAPHCHRVLGIEEYAPAIENARQNAVVNGIKNAEFFAARAEELLPQWAREGMQPQIIVLDPPRQGCHEKVITAAAAMKPARIIYVSCDPATLARDLSIFTGAGYEVKAVQPFDMFPQTGHVETVVLMSRVNK